MGQSKQLINFEELYADDKLRKWQLPAFADVKPVGGIFRKPYVKWSDLPPGSDQDGETDLFYVCTDVLEIDVEVQIMTGTFLFARRIVVLPGGSLIYHGEEKMSSLLVVTNQITDDKNTTVALPLTVISADGMSQEQREVKVSQGDSEISVYEIESGTTITKRYPSSELEDAYLLQDQPLRMFLRSEFQLATLLLNNHPWESIHQLDYVGAVASANPETRLLAGQARALATTLRSTQAISANGLLVPRLDYTIYADSAAKALNVLKLRQEQYGKFLDSIKDLKLWKENAELAFAVGGKQEDLTRELLLKAEETRRQMEQARAIAARQVAAIQISLIYKRKEFEDGVEEWKEKKILKNIFKIILGIVKILAQIPTLVATGPAAVAGIAKSAGSAAASLIKVGAGLAESAINKIKPTSFNLSSQEIEMDDMRGILGDGPQPEPPAPLDAPNVDQVVGGVAGIDAANIAGAAEQRAQEVDAQGAAAAGVDAAAAKVEADEAEAKQKLTTQEFMASANKVGAAGKEIADAAMDIAATVKQAAQMEAASQEAVVAINKGVGKSFADITPRGLDVVTGGSQVWERLSLTIKAFFALVPDEVPGKAAFEQEYDRLIISAQAMCQARLALAKANSELAEAMLRMSSAKETAKLYLDREKALGDKVAEDQVLAQLAFNKILDAKRSLYLYLEAYRRAFVYYTLTPLASAPPLPDLSAPYDAITVAVSNITNARLANERLGTSPKKMSNTLTLKGDALTREFKDKGVLQFVLKPKDEPFADYCRIRLNGIDVYVNGLTSPASIKVGLTNNGVYMDHDFSKRTRYFVADKYKSLMKYTTNDPSSAFGGRDDGDFKGQFFMPTPFSTWTLAFRSGTDEPINLADVTEIKIEFHGQYSIPT